MGVDITTALLRNPTPQGEGACRGARRGSSPPLWGRWPAGQRGCFGRQRLDAAEPISGKFRSQPAGLGKACPRDGHVSLVARSLARATKGGHHTRMPSQAGYLTCCRIGCQWRCLQSDGKHEAMARAPEPRACSKMRASDRSDEKRETRKSHDHPEKAERRKIQHNNRPAARGRIGTCCHVRPYCQCDPQECVHEHRTRSPQIAVSH